MKIKKMFDKGTVFSFEIFPPKKTSPVDTIYKTLEELKGLSPDFISVTFGAGGSSNNNASIEIARKIKQDYGIESVIHLPCINYTKDEMVDILGNLIDNGITNILALRGDITPDIPPKQDFRYASDLITFIKKYGDFDIAGACYPEGHIETENIVNDVLNLKKKVDAGAEHLISQLFFDNDYFYSFLERTQIAGIDIPIEAGIMPVTNAQQIKRIISISDNALPQRFIRIVDRYGDNPEAMKQAGIAFATEQVIDLYANGINAVHIYSMNKPDIASAIKANVSEIIR